MIERVKLFIAYLKKTIVIISTIWGLLGISFLSIFREDKVQFYFIVVAFILGYFALALYCILGKKKVTMPDVIDGVAINSYSLLKQKIKYNKNLRLEEANILIEVEGKTLKVNYTYIGRVKSLKKVHEFFLSLASEANMENQRRYKGYSIDNGTEHMLDVSVNPNSGMAQTLCFKFVSPKKGGDIFHVRVEGETENVFPLTGKTYYFVKFSFDKDLFRTGVKYNYIMKFKDKPESVQCYCIKEQGETFVRNCQIFDTADGYYIQDSTDKLNVNYIRLYIFKR